MKLSTLYKSIIVENASHVFYHGTKSIYPFPKFDPRLIGTGIVSSGNKYGGFFFTSVKANAEFYTEYLICTVKIKDIKLAPPDITSPNKLRDRAKEDSETYMIKDIYDGGAYSDIVFVPISKLNNITILNWELVPGTEDDWIESLIQNNSYYDTDEDGDETDDLIPPTQDYVDQMIRMTGGGRDYLMKFKPFKKWYNSLEPG